ncbi:class I SAM-dependent methyltransferase [Spirosoma fluviale]|uniref:Ubiquinone/menaquinone biosynthesis C-methylase UbiE n=1 Tax=Spirosoma fluviale TaxID=1597977 RepID=A0A286FE16_9BACT|nr:class I SAM-dependent methyltransferase [Spirosoma fluviale]SOD81450.1 Ubiquinone/menaquinone biosynthesis C-methylase UbiE [Spirosoma fluviale]
MDVKQNPGGNFNWIAPVYDALAFLVFGRKLQRAQGIFLDRIPPKASVLLVGGGTGWLLEQLLVRCKPERVLYLETSSQMVARATRRMARKSLPGTVIFWVGDETTLDPSNQFDVILTPFLLDLFNEQTLQNRLIPSLLRVLKPGGMWLVTDFVLPPAWWQKVLLWTMIRFFRLIAGIETRTLANWQQCLTDAGLSHQARKPQVDGMVSAEVWTR